MADLQELSTYISVSGQELRCLRLSGAWFYSRSSADVSAPHPIGLLWLALVPRSTASPPRALLLGFFGHRLLFSFRIVGIQQPMGHSHLKLKALATPSPIITASVPAISTAVPVAATPTTATPAVAPIAAAVNVTMLQNPPRHCQLPVWFRDNGTGSPAADKGESFYLENISGDEEDEVANPPALTAMPAAVPSPLQTVMNTARTDPLATGGQAKPPKSSADVHCFFRQDPVTQSRICIACK
ncbi:hypothetical protein BDR04DRAFT_1157831 [Suillus decipiens]|nr:hypothetical protein BDR04DRAFT_1157831 [Suillus decipiens]